MNDKLQILTGDGAAYGMGLSATSGAIERDLDFLYVCYDNEGYGNTGQQSSATTPHAANASTPAASALRHVSHRRTAAFAPSSVSVVPSPLSSEAELRR